MSRRHPCSGCSSFHNSAESAIACRNRKANELLSKPVKAGELSEIAHSWRSAVAWDQRNPAPQGIAAIRAKMRDQQAAT